MKPATAFETAIRREFFGLGLTFMAQLVATIVLCLISLGVAAASFIAIMTLAAHIGPEAFWPMAFSVVALGGLLVGSLAWLVANVLGKQRAKASPRFRRQRSIMGAIQLTAPSIAYLFFAYALITHTS